MLAPQDGRMHQFEYPYSTGSNLRRAMMVLLMVGGIAGGILALGFAVGIPPLTALAAPESSEEWDFADSALDDLRAIAIQICSAEARALSVAGTEEEPLRRAYVASLTDQYRAEAQAYNTQIRSLIATGSARPGGVESRALPVDLAKSTFCLRTEKSLPLATPTPVLPQLPPLAGYGSRVHRLTMEELDQYAAVAGWPNEPGWWPDMRRIIMCESGGNIFAHNTSDPFGGSWGLAQLNGRYHFDRAGEDFEQRFDPVVNLRTALWLRTARGHYGGGGGWKLCSDLLGIN